MKSIVLSILAFYLSLSSAKEFFSTNQCTCTSPDPAVPCGSTSGISICTSQINVNESGLIESIAVSVDIYHFKTDELIVTLLGPDGTDVILYSLSSNSINISTTYPTLSIPYHSLSVFTGKNMLGVWILHVRDIAGGASTIKGIKWSLNFRTLGTTQTTTTTSITSTKEITSISTFTTIATPTGTLLISTQPETMQPITASTTTAIASASYDTTSTSLISTQPAISPTDSNTITTVTRMKLKIKFSVKN
jgi:subtilisin-like proprotein convertase family protein